MELLIMMAIVAFCFAITETWTHHHSTSIFGRINPNTWVGKWTRKESWKNKYKNGDPDQGPLFFGSTTVFVWLTDMYHFFKLVKIIAIVTMAILPFSVEMQVIEQIHWIWVAVFLFFTYFVVFELFYSIIFRIRKK